MSERLKNGGPAFPIAPGVSLDSPFEDDQGRCGMSLRDWFAGQALGGILAQPDERTCPKETPLRERQSAAALEDARTCYAYAEAMLTERAKQRTV